MSALSLLAIRVAAGGGLSSEEQALLTRLAGESQGAEYSLEIVVAPPFATEDPPPRGEPARIEIADRSVRLTHDGFAAEVRPFERRILLYRRDPSDTFPLQATLRTTLACALPLLGGVTVHSAGVVIDGSGHLFYGQSGAGKSTLAGRSPYPLLSDEMVALFEHEGRLVVSATGFWGTLDRDDAPRGFFPLASITRIRKGDRLSLGPLTEQHPFLEALLVPAIPELWKAALSVAFRVLARVPHYQLTWSLDTDPWQAIAAIATGGAQAAKQ